MQSRAAFLVGLTLILSSVLPAAEPPRIHFQENFRNYSDKAPGVSGKGMVVSNDPIWANAADLNVRAEEDAAVFDAPIAAPALRAFDLLFTLCFINASAEQAGTLAVVLKDKQGQETLVSFTNTVVKKGAGTLTVSLPGQEGTLPGLRNWQREEVVLRADGKTLTVYVSRDRVLQKIVAAPFARSVVGVNIKATKDRHFSLRDIVLRDPGPLPAHPVTKHFADFRSLTQPLEKAQTATLGTPVVFKPAPTAGLVLRVGTGVPKVAEIKITWSNGKTTTGALGVEAQKRRAVMPVAGKKKGEALDLPDAALVLKIGRQQLRQYVRPHLKMFQSSYDGVPQYVDIVREWDRLPKASEHPLDIDLKVGPAGGLRVFFDGSYIATLTEEGARPESVAFTFHVPVQYRRKTDRYSKVDTAAYTLLDLKANPRAKAFADATLSLKPGVQTVEGKPFDVARPLDSADVAICKMGKGSWALEVEEYLGRSPLDGFPSAVHFRLPPAPYCKAHILLALDPDPQKVKVLTTRLGHYITNGVGGNMLGDHVIEIKGDTVPETFKQVGTVTLQGKPIPLYKVEIPLALGKVLDFAARREWIDFEFIGKGWINFEQLDRRMKPDPTVDSAFNIFAVTLEKAPVVMDMKQHAPGNVFTADEEGAKTTVTLEAVRPQASGTVRWRATGVDGADVFQGEKDFTLAKAGDRTAIDIPLGSRAVGYYDLAIELRDTAGNPLIVHPARFAIVGADRRKADRLQSPYATWWFNTHGSPGDMELGGPLMQKAGIRKASWTPITPAAAKQYNIANIGKLFVPGLRSFDKKTGKFKPGKVKDPKTKAWVEISGEEVVRRKLQEGRDKAPHADHVMIWHETAPGYGIPEELLNLEVPAPSDYHKRLAAYINEAGRIIRAFDPKLRIQIGNSSASIGAVTLPLRAGADPQYFDSIGIETPSQVIAPEKLQEVGLQGMVISKEIANRLAGGKKEVKLDGCYEFTYRCERDMGEAQQAEWYMRDILISLANNFTLISPGIFFDCSSGYYNGLWGGSGILHRAPYIYPKRAYVAYAALTNVLDRVTFSRQIPTGSTTVYALEFSRADGKVVTALWASRGAVTFALAVPSAKATVTEMYGKTYPLAGKAIPVAGGTSPVYVVTDRPVASVAIAKRTFPKGMALAERAQVAAALDDGTAVTLEPDPWLESTHTKFLPILKPADFTVEPVEDEEKGACLEVTLDLTKDKYKSKYITEYTTVRLKEAVPIPGRPAVIGLWVKGNSNWGQIRFEIEDAQGEVFKNQSTGKSWGCDILDWPGNLSVNFDGWAYVYQALGPTTLVNDHSPGPHSDQWVSEGGDKVIDLPIKLRAITVGMNRTKLDLLDFKASEPSIRLKNVGGIEE